MPLIEHPSLFLTVKLATQKYLTDHSLNTRVLCAGERIARSIDRKYKGKENTAREARTIRGQYYAPHRVSGEEPTHPSGGILVPGHATLSFSDSSVPIMKEVIYYALESDGKLANIDTEVIPATRREKLPDTSRELHIVSSAFEGKDTYVFYLTRQIQLVDLMAQHELIRVIEKEAAEELRKADMGGSVSKLLLHESDCSVVKGMSSAILERYQGVTLPSARVSYINVSTEGCNVFVKAEDEQKSRVQAQQELSCVKAEYKYEYKRLENGSDICIVTPLHPVTEQPIKAPVGTA